MNLWVKRTGYLLMGVLFLMSCEDDSFFLGVQNKNKKFKVRYQEFTLPSSVILIDSLITDNHEESGTTRLLIGEYVDTRFGTVRTEAYTQIQPSTASKLDPTSILDSVTFQLQLDLYSYGNIGESEERFTVHEITEDSLSFYKRYYYNSTLGYNPASLAEAIHTVNYDTLQKNAGLAPNAQDTLLVRVKLPSGPGEFGERLFNLAKDDPFGALLDNKLFRSEFKGLAFIPSQSNRVVGFNPSSQHSKVTLHYHTATADSLESYFYINPFSATGFNNITTTRTGDLAGISQPYQGFQPGSGSRFLQNGSTVITKVDISSFYDFIRGQVDGKDSLENIIVNSAELVINVIEASDPGSPPPSTLVLRVMNSNDMYVNRVIDADSASMVGFFLMQDGKYYIAGSDETTSVIHPFQPTALVYDASNRSYKGLVSVFLQNLFNRKQEDNELLYLGIVPVGPTPGKTVNRAVFNQNDIRLRVYYTTPTSSNPQ